MKGNYNIFYTPEKQYPGMPHGEMCGDFMPFYHDGAYHLFYLYKYCIYKVETTDFVRFSEPILALQNGSPDDQDWHIGTGSVFAYDGVFYFYYTGFCEGNTGVPGKHVQVILRAVSCDLRHWEKDKDFFFAPDTQIYGALHWRDPHVFWNEELEKFCMLITATEKEGAYQRTGCTAAYVSGDMKSWTHYKTLYAPRTFITHECHDCFKMGGRWYLTFSNYSRWWETRYRTAERFDGPWRMPEGDDLFDGRTYYAAKSVTDGKKRYMVGWQSIREGCRDSGRNLWGGSLLVHELVQRPDGSLGVKMPDGIRASFSRELPLHAVPRQGELRGEEEGVSVEAADGFGWAELGTLEETCLFEAELSWDEGTEAVGLMLHADGGLRAWCQLRLEIRNGRVLLDRSNRADGDQYYLDERPVRFAGNRAGVRVVVSGNIIEAYVEDTALSVRCYEIGEGAAGIFAEYGRVYCKEARLLAQE